MSVAGIWLGPEFEWQTRAACRKIPEPDRFFPATRPDKEAKALCAGCPVRDECLAHALAYDEPGVWAGTSAKERQLMKESK